MAIYPPDYKAEFTDAQLGLEKKKINIIEKEIYSYQQAIYTSLIDLSVEEILDLVDWIKKRYPHLEMQHQALSGLWLYRKGKENLWTITKVA